MNGIFKLRWVMLAVLGAWAPIVFCYAIGVIRVPDFGLVHTLIGPSIILVVLIPTSIKAIVSRRFFAPLWAIWTGIMVPLVNFVGESVTGLGHDCAIASVFAGFIAFAMILAFRIVEHYITGEPATVRS